ncbi:hypothetical protein ACNOYE_32765 [Nannocystaceae bacterium ST9]
MNNRDDEPSRGSRSMTDEERELWKRAIAASSEKKIATHDLLCQAFLLRCPGHVGALALRLRALAALWRFDDCQTLIGETSALVDVERQRITWGTAVGDYLSKYGYHAEAEYLLRDLCDPYPEPPMHVSIAIIDSVVAQGHLHRAMREIDALWARAPNGPHDSNREIQILETRAQILRSLGRFDAALGVLDILDALEPGANNQLRDDIEGAVQALNQIADSEDSTLWKAALAAFSDQRSSTCDVLCEAYLERHPGNLPAQALRLHALADLGRFDDCEDLIGETGSSMNDEQWLAWAPALADYLSRRGHHADAEKVLREACARNGEPPVYLVVAVAESLCEQGKLREGLIEVESLLAHLERGRSEVDFGYHTHILQMRVQLLRSLGRFEDALDAFVSLDAFVPGDNDDLRRDLEEAIHARRHLPWSN